MLEYNVQYYAPDGVRTYCLAWADLATMERVLKNFKASYLNKDGTGKAYPNGKGFYPFRNPRIVSRMSRRYKQLQSSIPVLVDDTFN